MATEVSSDQQEIMKALAVQASIDPQQEIERRVGFLCDQLVETGQHALVLGISGGVDSTIAGRLCQLAVEKARERGVEARFYAMRLPYGEQKDEDEAQQAIRFIQPDEVLVTNVKPAGDSMLDSLEEEAWCSRVTGNATS
ncbi:adenine nucleotide alpha hydrolase family protein [Modicisalibacter luteus]|uniref:hypothetical protein n=1 Tax=Modicisalibacter luteus TaxID=453962 RepID=UPI00363FE89A